MTHSKGQKLVVITGCDGGIGKELCRIFLDKGYPVLASYLNQPPFPADSNLFLQQLDLRKEESAIEFCAKALELTGKGYQAALLVNNAGMVLTAPVENMPIEGLREIFEVNYFGVYLITQRLIPSLIESKGRIVIIGSMAGRIGFPYFSPYVSSKFAIEGLTESLRREMNPFGVKTILFEPSAIATPIWNNSWERISRDILPKVGERYRQTFSVGGKNFVAGGNLGLPADIAAMKIYRCIIKKNPKARYIISGKPLIDKLALLLPTKLLDKIIGGMFSGN